MKCNKGYTLVEALIVIAIIAILGGVSIFSIGIIRDARCSAAVSEFDNQISNTLVKTKALSDAGNNHEVCMYITQLTNSKNHTYFYVKVGYDSGTSGTVSDIRKSTEPDKDDSSSWDIVFPKDIDKITLQADTSGTETNITSQKIKFDKSVGSIKSGYGTYKFYKGDRVVAEIYLDKSTGKHHIISGR